MQTGASESGTQLLDLDAASLCAIFSWLSAKQLATAALVCSTFREAAQSSTLWMQLLSDDFGVAVTAQHQLQPVAVAVLYKRLLHGSLRALPCRAICTDGGCDDPSSSTYWVSFGSSWFELLTRKLEGFSCS